MNPNGSPGGSSAPQVLYVADSGSPRKIAAPGLLSFRTALSVLMLSPIAADAPAFIFPGILVVATGKIFYISASDLQRYKDRGLSNPESVPFQTLGVKYAIPARKMESASATQVLFRESLDIDGNLEVIDGSLLRDTNHRLYHLKIGELNTVVQWPVF